jgi:hypothetical protein
MCRSNLPPCLRDPVRSSEFQGIILASGRRAGRYSSAPNDAPGDKENHPNSVIQPVFYVYDPPVFPLYDLRVSHLDISS